MSAYESISLMENLVITEIYSIHYFEYTKDFVYEGESHDFWELLCVDNGVIEVTAGDQNLVLEKGEMIFHKPNEFHALRANGQIAPNLIVISFDCDASCMDFFRDRIVTINDTEGFYLGQILTEAKKTFYTPLNNPYICKLERYPHTAFGSEQIIKISLESMLISLFRRYSEEEPLFAYEQAEHPMLHRNHDIFHKKKGCGVMEYFSWLKIEAAKKLIRENRYNYSQIANLLGYSSYQYFSLQFKNYTRMTPSQYHRSIKSFSE